MVIRPLFLDKLRSEFELIKNDSSTRQRARLDDYLERLTQLKFLDPACGCGNFLVIAFRELRLLELDALKLRHGTQTSFTLDEVNRLSRVDVDQFYGIEISEWPARIAEVALWLMDHQMNIKVSEAFGQLYQRLPLRRSPHITIGNALRLDWQNILASADCSYILGNPPFVGKNLMSPSQDADIRLVIGDVPGSGVLDYVTAWYFKAAAYMANSGIRAAFVSTNSISQGEQPAILWNELFHRYHAKILFAYRTFSWTSEAEGKAHVHVVIIGFALADEPGKRIFEADPVSGVVNAVAATNISPYLVEGGDIVISSRRAPLCGVPEMRFGNMPNDGGHLLLSAEQKERMIAQEPRTSRFIRPFLSGEDFINGSMRWCIWLQDVAPAQYRSLKQVMERIENVRQYRKRSKRETTQQLARIPSLFGEIRQPNSTYLAIPEVSSERRAYIPIAFLAADVVCSNTLRSLPDATSYHFGILSSKMHMAWVKQVAGRLKSDFRYSNTLVYNNFPWPENPSDRQRAAVERAAEVVLDARTKFPDSTLADLYDPRTMPPELLRAHAELDRAVDRCYRPEPFTSDRQRVEYLFSLYERLTAPLLPAPAARRRASRIRTRPPASASPPERSPV